jgi:small-conductance mechanosensitive channel
VNPSGFILWCIRVSIAGAALALAAATARGVPTDEWAASLRDQISALEGVVEATKNAPEKARLEEKLQRLKRELALLYERQALEARELQLRADSNAGALDGLREKLRVTDFATGEAQARLEAILARGKQAAVERDALSAQVAAEAQRSAANPARLVQVQERLFTKTEELRTLALEREAVEREIELAHYSDQLREQVKVSDAAGLHPTLQALYEAYTRVGSVRKSGRRLELESADLDQSLKVSQGTLDVAQQKLAKFAEELALLEKQTGFFSRDAQIERLLVEERSQQEALTDRMPFLSRQVAAIKKSQAELTARQELSRLETAFQSAQLEALKTNYFRRLRWPAVALSGLIIFYLLASYLVLPLAYKNESLFIARRLVRYLIWLAATVVVAGFLFDDLQMVAAALGLVSAALVISLQDVCTSVFGWFVIMLGSKFKIGDRLEIEETCGDVIDIDLLRTTLIEVNGWLKADDQQTGRVLTIPNNFVFKTKVFNFAHGHPFIWGKIDLTITFSTSVAAAMALFRRVLEEETREQFAAARQASRKLQRRYGVEDAEYTPKIDLEITDSGVTFSLFYVTHYRKSSDTRNQLNQRLVAELESHPQIQLAYKTMQLLHDQPTPGAPTAVLGAEMAARMFQARNAASAKPAGAAG